MAIEEEDEEEEEEVEDDDDTTMKKVPITPSITFYQGFESCPRHKN